jgi:hypothetical protein
LPVTCDRSVVFSRYSTEILLKMAFNTIQLTYIHHIDEVYSKQLDLMKFTSDLRWLSPCIHLSFIIDYQCHHIYVLPNCKFYMFYKVFFYFQLFLRFWLSSVLLPDYLWPLLWLVKTISWIFITNPKSSLIHTGLQRVKAHSRSRLLCCKRQQQWRGLLTFVMKIWRQFLKVRTRKTPRIP